MTSSYSTEKSISFVHKLHKDLKSKRIMLAFEGGFTQNLTKNILFLAENRLNQTGEHISVKKKVFNVMMECLQNISKHAGSTKPVEGTHDGIFIIGKDETGYFLISGNFIKNTEITELERKINEVNSLDREGLRSLYLTKIQETELTKNSTAGLGLIDIARKSGNKLKYDFFKIDEKQSFYTLTTYVIKPELAE